MRIQHKITRLAPIQQDTVILEPKSFIAGTINEPVNVVGSSLASKIALSRNKSPFTVLNSGHYRITVKDKENAMFVVENLIDGTKSETKMTLGVNVNVGLIPGVDIMCAPLSSDVSSDVNDGDYVEFEVLEDQTYIIPGTILGRLVNGNWAPVTETNKNVIDAVAVCNGFQETDKSKNHPVNHQIVDVSNNYAVEVIVYGQVIESACREINLTDELKAKLTNIAWI